MRNLTLKSILYTAFGYTSAAIFSFACFYALIYTFALNMAIGVVLTVLSIFVAYRLVSHTEFIGEYEESLDF